MAVGLFRLAKASGARSIYYVAAYWTINIALVLAEARWHLIYRLTLWDIEQLKLLTPAIRHFTH